MTLTPDEFPAGTRVESTISGDTGTVTGWVRDNIGVRWDAGGTSSGPASHGGLRPETERPTGDNDNWREDGWYCQHSYNFCSPCFAGYDHPADEARDRACTACDNGYPATACSSTCDCGAC